MHICNLFPDTFGMPATRIRRASQNRRKYLEKIEKTNPARFDELLQEHGLMAEKHGGKAKIADPATAEKRRRDFEKMRKHEPEQFQALLQKYGIDPSDPGKDLLDDEDDLFGHTPHFPRRNLNRNL